MKAHKVKQGEDMVSIAAQYGFADWKAVYNHSSNKRLKEMRPNPFCLAPNDIVYIPEQEPITFKLATNQKHNLKIQIPKRKFHVEFQNVDGEPLADIACTIRYADRVIDETTNGQGAIEKELPFNVKTVDVIIKPEDGDEMAYRFNVSGLDPVDEVTGIQERLKNLGYYEYNVDGAYFHKSSDAVKRFQEDYGLEPTGSIDDATKNKIIEVYET